MTLRLDLQESAHKDARTRVVDSSTSMVCMFSIRSLPGRQVVHHIQVVFALAVHPRPVARPAPSCPFHINLSTFELKLKSKTMINAVNTSIIDTCRAGMQDAAAS